MTVMELIVELARVENQNAEVIFAYVSQNEDENDLGNIAFHSQGRAKKDAAEVQWIRDMKPNAEIFIIG